MINVIGLGYIGLPTALMLAKSGNEVVGTDCNNEIIEKMNSGELTFKESGLEQLYIDAFNKGIKFSSRYQETDFYIVAVPTPYIKESKKIEPKFVISAIKSIIEVCKEETTIVIESTISPGTIDKFIRPIISELTNKKINIAHAPERIIPGFMISELENNSRTIGADNIVIAEKVKKIYSTFCKGEIVLTDIRTAEMTKVVENSFRDVNIAFANELAKICNESNMNVYEVIKIANKHPRVNILNPGPGVGGHCISVDPWFLVGDYPEVVNIIKSARVVNDSMPDYVINRIKKIMEMYQIKDIRKVGLYGLTYKENIDDTRESPTLQLIEKLENHLSYGIKSYDPLVNKKIVENQYFDFEKFIEDIKILVIMVNHKHITENIDSLENLIVLDTKNIINKKDDLFKL